MVQLAVGDKEPIVVIDGETVDPAEVGFVAVTDELGSASFSIEDKDGPDFLIGYLHQTLGVDRDAVGPDQLKWKSLGIEFFFLGLPARQTVHPG